jgi:4'-phosphopantetheinyl transferase
VEDAGLGVGEDEVHLYFADPREAVRAAALPHYREVLGRDEIERAERFHFEKDRVNYMVAHALVRETLGRYLRSASSALRFETNPWGRPFLAGELEGRLQFNLSRSRDLVLLGVTKTRALGVDVEYSQRRGVVEIADRYFAPTEVGELRRLAEAEQQGRFFDYWTLKESYIKARGMGLSLELDKFAFSMSAEAAIALTVEPELSDHGDHWDFLLLEPDGEHKAAVAVERVLGRPFAWSAFKAVPWGGANRFQPRVLRRSL